MLLIRSFEWPPEKGSLSLFSLLVGQPAAKSCCPAAWQSPADVRMASKGASHWRHSVRYARDISIAHRPVSDGLGTMVGRLGQPYIRPKSGPELRNDK